jgi:hypothetical protein
MFGDVEGNGKDRKGWDFGNAVVVYWVPWLKFLD